MEATDPCFLCRPDPSLVYLESDALFAMLGWGPIGEGYSLIVAREHIPSMMDLSSREARLLQEFTDEVRDRLRPLFGDCVVTEHGRVAACLETATTAYEPHCLHAHRLVFPGLAELDLPRLAPHFAWHGSGSIEDAHSAFDSPGQYIYADFPDGSSQVAPVAGPLPRQLFRALVASVNGRPEDADWRTQPRLDLVEAARKRLGIA